MRYFEVEANQAFAGSRSKSVRGVVRAALLALQVWIVFGADVAQAQPDLGPRPVSATLSLQSGLQPGAWGRNRIPVNRDDPAFTVERLDLSPAIYLDVVMSDGTRSGPHAYLQDFASNIVFDTSSGDPNRLLKVVYWDVVRNDPHQGKYAAQLTATGNGVGLAYLKVSFRNAPGVTASVSVEIVGSAPIQQLQVQVPLQQQVPPQVPVQPHAPAQFPLQQQVPANFQRQPLPQVQLPAQLPMENYPARRWRYQKINPSNSAVVEDRIVFVTQRKDNVLEFSNGEIVSEDRAVHQFSLDSKLIILSTPISIDRSASGFNPSGKRSVTVKESSGSSSTGELRWRSSKGEFESTVFDFTLYFTSTASITTQPFQATTRWVSTYLPGEFFPANLRVTENMYTYLDHYKILYVPLSPGQ